jgi:hypothetical protein
MVPRGKIAVTYVSLKDFKVFLWRFDTAMRAASYKERMQGNGFSGEK